MKTPVTRRRVNQAVNQASIVIGRSPAPAKPLIDIVHFATYCDIYVDGVAVDHFVTRHNADHVASLLTEIAKRTKAFKVETHSLIQLGTEAD